MFSAPGISAGIFPKGARLEAIPACRPLSTVLRVRRERVGPLLIYAMVNRAVTIFVRGRGTLFLPCHDRGGRALLAERQASRRPCRVRLAGVGRGPWKSRSQTEGRKPARPKNSTFPTPLASTKPSTGGSNDGRARPPSPQIPGGKASSRAEDGRSTAPCSAGGPHGVDLEGGRPRVASSCKGAAILAQTARTRGFATDRTRRGDAATARLGDGRRTRLPTCRGRDVGILVNGLAGDPGERPRPIRAPLRARPAHPCHLSDRPTALQPALEARPQSRAASRARARAPWTTTSSPSAAGTTS